MKFGASEASVREDVVQALQGVRMKAFLCLVLIGCSATVETVETDPVELECLPAPLEIARAEVCYDDEQACPQDVAERPWEAVCGRAYMCEFKQPDGRFEWVCTRARDCDCLEAWADCSGDDVPIPGYCEPQDP